MSFLDEGVAGRVPTAQTFPPNPPQTTPETARETPQAAEAEDYSANRSKSFPAFLKALVTMSKREVRRLNKLGNALQDWAAEVDDISNELESQIESLQSLVQRIEAIPVPSLDPVPESGVKNG